MDITFLLCQAKPWDPPEWEESPQGQASMAEQLPAAKKQVTALGATICLLLPGLEGSRQSRYHHKSLQRWMSIRQALFQHGAVWHNMCLSWTAAHASFPIL